MQNGLHVQGVTAGYKRFSIRQVSFSLQPGDILGLVGKSGAGKSTLIKTLLGVLPTKKGAITVVDNKRKQQLRHVVGYSAQDHSLFEFLSVQENIELFAQLQGQHKQVTTKRLKKLLDTFSLLEHKHKQIRSLSGGMRKRVDLCVALIHDPAIIILDEPFAGLDVSIQQFIWETIQALANNGKIVIISSHLLENLERYCTKWALVHNNYFYDDKRIREEKEHYGADTMREYLIEVFNN